jgi:EAL domain-containing protein (putative c-di-GMP-specific phosphodiesterase class I)
MQLKLCNVRISIDDFGAAYSTFARLCDLPFSELKLDRSFVSDCSSNPFKRTMCRSAIDLAHSAGGSACAEGVETIHDLKSLIGMGCDTAQGFLFGKPQPVEVFAAMLRAPTMQALANAIPSDGVSG